MHPLFLTSLGFGMRMPLRAYLQKTAAMLTLVCEANFFLLSYAVAQSTSA